MPQIKTFIINLKRSKNRKEYIQKILYPLNIQYEIFEATDGQDLSEKEYQTIKQRGKNITKTYPWRTLMARSEIGCALSHLRIYQKIVKEKIAYACILEDDIIIKNAENFQYCLMEENLISLQKKKEWDFIYLYATHTSNYYYWDKFFGSPSSLGTKWGGKKIKENLYLKKLEGLNFCGAVAYIINQKAAKTFLADNWPVKKLSDVLTASAEYLGLKQYAICPMPLSHNEKIKTTVQNHEAIIEIKKGKTFKNQLLTTLKNQFRKSLIYFLLRKMGVLNLKILIKKRIYYN